MYTKHSFVSAAAATTAAAAAAAAAAMLVHEVGKNNFDENVPKALINP